MYLLGMTATPTHAEEKKRGWFSNLFPQGILSYATVEELMAAGILAKPIFEDARTDFTPHFDEREYRKWMYTYRDLPEDLITQLAENQERNEFISETYVQNQKRYGKTIIFADRWWQCEAICEYLLKNGVRADVVYSHFDADPGNVEARNKRDRNENSRVLEDFRHNKLDVLLNVRMLTEGTDVPNINTVFLTRQTTSQILVTQMVGRALRGPEFDGTDTAYIVSFIDSWREMIDWGVPQLLIGGVEGETAAREIKPLDLISIELVRRFSRDMIHGGADIPPFISLLPMGWYKIEYTAAVDGGETQQVDR
jgi:superfamily II DNA or RNA helicase